MDSEKTTLIDAQADVEGTLKGRDARILGRFRGEANLAGHLVLGEGSRAEATLKAESAEVAGELKGDLQAARVVLGERARFEGTIDAGKLIVREGAVMNARVATGNAAQGTRPE
jgi:cytoskeletal protein CcmA (bactofilin family)